jgi:EAL domain-containing protein (putative c-di-GMP-specific phosphodiesterase class I)
VTDARLNSADSLIVTTVRDLAHGMGALVVAEFCTDQANYDWLAANGIDLVQGYHLSPPELIREGLLPWA